MSAVVFVLFFNRPNARTKPLKLSWVVLRRHLALKAFESSGARGLFSFESVLGLQRAICLSAAC